MRGSLVLLAALAAAPVARAEVPPEVQLALQSLRSGERERLLRAQGPVEELPLYRAELEVDPQERRAQGKVVVTWVARDRAAEWLPLRVTPNAIDKTRVKLSHATVNGQPALMEQPEPTLYRVKLDPPLVKGTAAVVEVRLQANLPEAPPNSDRIETDVSMLHGRSADFGAFMAAPEVVSLAGLLPGVPPTLDGKLASGPSGIGDLALYEPAHYLVTVLAPRGWTVVAAGAALGEVPEKDGRTRFAFGLAAARDFGLLLTRGYRVDTMQVEGVTVESHFLPQDLDAGARTTRYAAQALQALEKKLGPYPWTTLRVVQARLVGGAGGMEFPGLVTVATGLYRGAVDPLAALGMPSLMDIPLLRHLGESLKPMLETTLEFTVAHEVAHQWFPMTVGSDPVDAPVVDEALAQHLALLVLEQRHGRKAADQMRDAQLKMAYQFHRLTSGKDGPALRSTREFDTTAEYAALVYGKAPLLYDNLRKLAGDKAYFAALRQYADSFRWRWAGPATFSGVLGRQVPKHAKAFEEQRHRWWLEAKGDDDLGVKGVLDQDLDQLLSGGGAGQLDDATRQLLEEAIRALQGGGP